MGKQMRVGVKAALITTGGAIFATLLIIFFSKSSNSDGKKENNISQQNTQTQSTIVNLNIPKDTQTIELPKAGPKVVVPFKAIPLQNKEVSKKQFKNEIINNAPNQGVQINENNGTVVVGKPVTLPRKFTVDEAKNILKDYPVSYPLEIWIKGFTKESENFCNQVINIFQELGHLNISKNIINITTREDFEKDFKYNLENGKLVFSIYPQQ